jgi:hypothetical protein
MNEIERAIQIIERQKLQIGIDYTNGKDLTAICLVGNSAETALTALREKAEREKGCRYCQDKSYKQKGYYVDDPEGEIVGINHYCMNCGKRLEVEP